MAGSFTLDGVGDLERLHVKRALTQGHLGPHM